MLGAATRQPGYIQVNDPSRSPSLPVKVAALRPGMSEMSAMLKTKRAIRHNRQRTDDKTMGCIVKTYCETDVTGLMADDDLML